MPLHIPLIFLALRAPLRDRADLVAENIALRQQLASLHHLRRRSRLRPIDCYLWAVFSRHWPRWRQLPVIVRPSTVMAWSRRRRLPGRPPLDPEIRRLIVEMASSNVGWGAPRIHGELRKLGIEVSQAPGSRYMSRRPPRPGSQRTWSTFLTNHRHELLAIGFAVVPTVAFRILYVFFVMSVDRRRIQHFNVARHPTARWTEQ